MQEEYKELVENKLCEDFYTASEIVDFMRANDIPFSCRGRLPALVTSYLLNFITLNPYKLTLKVTENTKDIQRKTLFLILRNAHF